MRLFELFEGEQNIEWAIPRSCRVSVGNGSEVVVWVDVAKLDASFATDRNFYVGPSGSGAGIAGRYPRFDAWVRQGQPVEMSECGFDYRDRATFVNGRHRFAWMRDHGALAVPLVTQAERAEEFLAAFGTGLRQTTVRL